MFIPSLSYETENQTTDNICRLSGRHIGRRRGLHADAPAERPGNRAADGSLVFNDLIIATRTISSASNIRIAASPITYALSGGALQFPEPVNVGFDGSGTAADPYRITRAEDFRSLAAAMSMPGYASANYKVMNDIDLCGKR